MTSSREKMRDDSNRTNEIMHNATCSRIFGMMLITSMWLVDILIFFVVTTFLLYKYFARKYNYWKIKGVYYIQPIPFFGNIFRVISFKSNMGSWLQDLYNTTNEPYFGIFIFDEPYLVLKSKDIIKQVLVRDFHYFVDRTILAPKHNKLFENMMFIQKNPDWKIERPRMTPLFTSGKLKAMFSKISNTGLELTLYIERHLGDLECKEICAKYATDTIAKCAFAINANCFYQEDAEFRKTGRCFFDFTFRNAFNQGSFFYMHGIANLFKLEFVEKWASEYLADIVWQALKKREETNEKGNDLIDILVDIRKDKEFCSKIKFEGEKVVSHAVQFFAAGFETTSSTMAFTLYELCIQPNIQDKLRREILENMEEHNGITYDGIQKMKYLDMCVLESLRKYPALPFLDRQCNADYKIPGTNIVIEKGTKVYVPMLGLHYDRQYFPDPETYNPERFVDKARYNRDGLYYLPFGEGPRMCIGERFGMLSAKTALAFILSKFVVERTSNTPFPLIFEPRSFVLQSKTGLPMRFKQFYPE